MLVQVAAAAAGPDVAKAADAFLQKVYQGAADAGVKIAGVSKVRRVGESVNQAGDTATLFVRIGRDGSVLPPRGTGDNVATSILQIDVLPDRVPGPDGQLHTRWVAYAKQYDTATAKLIESSRSGPSTDQWREWEAGRPDSVAYQDPEFRQRVLDAMPSEPGEAVRQALAPLVGDANRLARGGLESSLAAMDEDGELAIGPEDEDLPGLEPLPDDDGEIEIGPGDEDLPGLEPDEGEGDDWGDADFTLNITLPNGAVATVYGPLQPDDPAAGLDFTITPAPGTPPPETAEPPTGWGGGSETSDFEDMSPSDSRPGCTRPAVMMSAAAAVVLATVLVFFFGGGGDAPSPVAVESGGSPAAPADASSSGEPDPEQPTDAAVADAGLCPGDGTHGFTDTPIVFSSPDLPAGPLPERYQRHPRKTDFPTPAFRWSDVPKEATQLGIVMIWLPAEPADRTVDPWRDGVVEGVLLWIVSGIDPAAGELPASSLASPLPAGVVQHRNYGTQVLLPDGTLSDRVLVGAMEGDLVTADGQPWSGPFLFTVFAYCTPLGPDAVDAGRVDLELFRRSVARGWFYVDSPWS